MAELYDADSGIIGGTIEEETTSFKKYNVNGNLKDGDAPIIDSEQTILDDTTTISDGESEDEEEKTDDPNKEYEKTVWVNNVTHINQSNLNHIESGIANNRLSILAIKDEISGIGGNFVPKRLSIVKSVKLTDSNSRMSLFVDFDGEDRKISMQQIKDKVITSVDNEEEALNQSNGAYIFIKED